MIFDGLINAISTSFEAVRSELSGNLERDTALIVSTTLLMTKTIRLLRDTTFGVLLDGIFSQNYISTKYQLT